MSSADKISAVFLINRGKFDAIVMLHSVFSNGLYLSGPILWSLKKTPIPKVYFIGNEYKLMPEKMRFCKRIGISLLITQTNEELVLQTYREFLKCKVIYIPNAGIDPTIFYPMTPSNERKIDIGYRSYPAVWYLGNNEKTEIADFFNDNAKLYGLTVDISTSLERRFKIKEYSNFLNQCRAQIGVEAGGDYFDLSDSIRLEVNKYLKNNPKSSWPDIKNKFFNSNASSVPIRVLSGRQVEAAACKAVQILFIGEYNKHFFPNQHYIPLEKDFSNITEVIEKFRDKQFCLKLTENAYQMVLEELTYDHLVKKLYVRLRDII